MITTDKAEKNQTGIFKRCRNVIIPLITLALPSAALATPTVIDFGALDFSSTNQGMWGSGSAPGLNIDRFIGTSWNISQPVGQIYGQISSTTLSWPHYHWPSGWECHGFLCVNGHYHHPGYWHTHHSTIHTDTRSGARLDVNTSGKVGFQFGLKADSGSVNTDVKFDASLLVPDATTLSTGSFFNLNPSSSLAGGSLSTNFPNISAKLDAIVGVRASIDNAQVCAIGFGCSAKGSSGQLGFADQTVPLVSFNQPDSPGKIKVLGLFDPGVFQFDNPISVGGKLNLTVHVPDITTSAGVSGNKLVSSGADDLIKLTADLDALALAPLGLPGGGVEFNAGILNVSADIIDIQAGPVLTVKQNFEFNPSLYVNLSFDNPVNIAGKYNYVDVPDYSAPIYRNITNRECIRRNVFGNCLQYKITTRRVLDGYQTVSVQAGLAPQTSWFGRWDQLPDIALLSPETRVTPTFSVQGDFLNNTFLGIDGFFQLDILQATLALEKFGLSFDLGGVGPLYEYIRQSNLFNTSPLFSRSFGLGGFNNVAGDSFLLRTASAPSLSTKSGQGSGTSVSGTSVPEPAPVLLLLFGLVALGLSRRKFR